MPIRSAKINFPIQIDFVNTLLFFDTSKIHNNAQYLKSAGLHFITDDLP